jgi:hypothetical protein
VELLITRIWVKRAEIAAGECEGRYGDGDIDQKFKSITQGTTFF